MRILSTIATLFLLGSALIFLVRSKSYFKIWQKFIIEGGLTFLIFFELEVLGKTSGLFGMNLAAYRFPMAFLNCVILYLSFIKAKLDLR